MVRVGKKTRQANLLRTICNLLISFALERWSVLKTY